MIHPTQGDIGRQVIYRERGTHAGRKVEHGVLTSFTERCAFVCYSGLTSAATDFADLEWRSMTKEELRTEGEAMCAEILAAVAPVVDGRRTPIVLDAMAGAMLAAVMAGCSTKDDMKLVLRRFAARVTTLAENL